MRHAILLERIRAEFVEIPGLRVTLDQAQRLFGVDSTLCKTVFDALLDQQFLRVNARGMYLRASDGDEARFRSAKAGFGVDRRTVAAS